MPKRPDIYFILFIYEFLSRIASSVLKVNCYQWGSCVGGPSVFNSPFGHRSRSHNICPLDNHLSGLSISPSSLVLSWVYRLPFFKSLVWLGCDSNSQPSVLVASTLPLHYQSVMSCSCSCHVRPSDLLYLKAKLVVLWCAMLCYVVLRKLKWLGWSNFDISLASVARVWLSSRMKNFII